jgi:hypothetical protein
MCTHATGTAADAQLGERVGPALREVLTVGRPIAAT